MNVYGLMASIRVSSDKDSISVIEEFVAERLAAKDKEIGELKAEIELLTEANKGLGNGYDLVLESSDRHLSEVYRLREGMEWILRSQAYEGFLLVDPSAIEALLNPGGGKETPVSTAKDSSDDAF